MMKRRGKVTRSLAVLVAMSTFIVPAAGRAADKVGYSAGLGFEFASGTFGTGVRTDSVYAPFTASVYPTDRLDFTLEIPFVYQSSSAVVAGQYLGMQSQFNAGPRTMAAMAGPGMGGSTMGSGMGTSASPATVNDAQYGLGDVKLKAGYVLYTEEEYVPAIRPNFFVKFPTADKSRFLGTGAFDEGFAVELTKWYGNWLADGEGGYTIQGKSTILPVENYFYYYAGGGYQLTEKLVPMLLVKGSTPTVEGASPLLEVRLKVKYQFTGHSSLDGYLAKGVERDSPDYGIGLAFAYDF